MAPERKKVGKIVDLAERIEADIRLKNLQPGDRYLSTIDTARMLRVDTTVANRALQLLVKRHILQRRQKVGTFVSDGLLNADEEGDGSGATIRSVHFLMSDPEIRTEGLLDSGAILGLQSALPNVRLQFDSVPRLKEAEHLQQIVADALRVRHTEGFVLLDSTLAMQRTIAASGIPAVVFGRLYPSVRGLPFVDRDQRQVGRLLAAHLLQRGHRRIVLLTRQHLLPGDHVTLDAVLEEMASAGLSAADLTLRCLPHDEEVVQAEVRQVLQETDQLPGILARVSMMADAAMEVIESEKFSQRKGITVVAADHFGPQSMETRYPVIRPRLDFQQQGALIGRMLGHLAEGRPLDRNHELIDVDLVVPRTHDPG